MALIPLTPANLRLGSGTTCSAGVAGEAISPFDFIYLNSNGKYLKAINTTLAESSVVGVALSYAALDGSLAFAAITAGSSYIDSSSSTWTKGLVYVVGDTAGQLMLPGDLTTGQFNTVAGIAASTTSLLLYNTASGLVA
jgi:hypothetical protein